MSNAFRPLDLTPLANVSTDNIPGEGGYYWPYRDGDPDRTVLDQLPRGDCRFWGVPFAVADRTGLPDSTCFIVARNGQQVDIPVGDTARRLLFAHVCAPLGCSGATVEGAGEAVGSYRIVYGDGSFVEFALRRRFEIHDVTIPWGHHPFLCRQCSEFHAVPLGDSSIPWGRVQTGVDSRHSDLSGWWLLDWENPEPQLRIEHVEFVGTTETPVLLGAITLCDEEGDPFAWPPREELAVAVEGCDEAPEVTMERGVVSRQDHLFVPSDDYLDTDETGWGRGGQVREEGGYVEIHGSPHGTITVSSGGEERASITLQEVLDAPQVSKGNVRVERIAPRGTQWVHVRVVDEANGKPVGCRVHFRSIQGAYFAPHGHQSDVNVAWFEDMGGDCKVKGTPYAYIDGTCQIELPIGPVFVEVVRGFEYVPLRVKAEVKPGQRNLSLTLRRAFDMKQRGYYSGDTHVHFLTAQSSHLEAAAEDLNVANLLVSQWGRLFTSWEEFTGGLAPTSSDEHKIWVSQENRQHVLGHISLLGLREMVAPICSGGPPEDWVGGEIQVLMADWAEACRQQGGLVIMPHMPTPDFENAANIVLGQADAAEMCWIWQGEEIGQGERGYYRWLNCGQKLPIVGGTDKMSNGRILGGSRTYAQIEGNQPFTFENWCHAVRRGNTFASTGAMIDLRADGAAMGDEIHLPGNGGKVEVVATAESVWPLTAVELIVNGARSAREYADGDHRTVTVRFELEVGKPCWVAARCWGDYSTDAGPVMAHSSPIYMTCGGRRPFVEQEGQYLLTHMEGGISWAKKIGVFRDEKVRARLIALFEEAKGEVKRRAMSWT